MENNRLDLGAAVDIDTLISRIREAVKKRSEARPASTGKGTAPPFKAQADFNQSLVEALGTMAASMEDGQKSMAAIDERLQRTTETVSQVGEQTNQLSARLEQVSQQAEGAVTGSAKLERSVADKLTSLTALLEDVRRQTATTASQSAAVQESIAQRLTEFRGDAQARLAAVDGKLQEAANYSGQALQQVNERIDRLGAAINDIITTLDGAMSQSAGLADRMGHELVALRTAHRETCTGLQNRLEADAQQRYLELSERLNRLDARLGEALGHLDRKLDALGAQAAALDQRTERGLDEAARKSAELQQKTAQQLEELAQGMGARFGNITGVLEQQLELVAGQSADLGQRLGLELQEVNQTLDASLVGLEKRLREQTAQGQAR